MNLDVILGENLLELGFEINEEEDLIYLKHKGELVAVFASWTATVKEIKDAARDWLGEHNEKEEK